MAVSAFPASRFKELLRAFGAAEKVFLCLLLVTLVVEFTVGAGSLLVLLTFATFVCGVIVAAKLAIAGTKKAIWRLRNRLLVAYLFIAVVPVLLILLLAGIGAWLLTGQIAAYLVRTELDRRAQGLMGPAQGLAGGGSQFRLERARWLAPWFRDRYPGFEMLIREGGTEWRYPDKAAISAPPSGWGEISGLLLKNNKFYLWAHAVQDGVEVTMMAPTDADGLSTMIPALANVSLITPGMLDEGQGSRRRLQPSTARRSKDHVPPAVSLFDRSLVFLAPVPVGMWDPPETEGYFMLVETRYSAVLSTLFGQQAELFQGITVQTFATLLFVGLSVLFFVVEMVSLVIGIRLTRTITGAVHGLYEGTQRIRGGDFSHRIEVTGSDQLAVLSHSFNRMTENLQELLEVAKEKERMQSELEIAREVQNQLYPKAKPASETLELAASCAPARTVSGDYYDFQNVQDSRIALAIGDVAGKGISAALLMATVQANMRTQLRSSRELAKAAGNGNSIEVLSTATLITRLNQQLYAYTPPEKFATFYFAIYDDISGMLTYTNAGHLPPVLMRRGEVTRLDVNGTVVGAFPFSRYGESTLQLEPGDMLVCFTDGITEPENEYGEMFGEERLIETVVRNYNRTSDEVIAAVMASVRDWTGTPELQDDMTMLVARRS